MRFNTDRRNRLSFDRIAEHYRARPDVPDAAIDWCIEHAELPGRARVLEVGAGTGQLTAPLLRLQPGIRVDAIEPGTELGRVLSERLDACDRLTVSGALFEEVTLAEPVDSIWSANAFHWIDPDVAYERAWELLTPGGSLVLIWSYLLVADAALRQRLRENVQGADLVAFLPEQPADLFRSVADSTAAGRAELVGSRRFEVVAWHELVDVVELAAADYPSLALSFATASHVDAPDRLRAAIAADLREQAVGTITFEHHIYAVVARASTHRPRPIHSRP